MTPKLKKELLKLFKQDIKIKKLKKLSVKNSNKVTNRFINRLKKICKKKYNKNNN